MVGPVRSDGSGIAVAAVHLDVSPRRTMKRNDESGDLLLIASDGFKTS